MMSHCPAAPAAPAGGWWLFLLSPGAVGDSLNLSRRGSLDSCEVILCNGSPVTGNNNMHPPTQHIITIWMFSSSLYPLHTFTTYWHCWMMSSQSIFPG